MVASILSIEPLVVVSLVPRSHLYWSGYKANLLARPTSGRNPAAAENKVWNAASLERFWKANQKTTTTSRQGTVLECTTNDYEHTEF